MAGCTPVRLVTKTNSEVGNPQFYGTRKAIRERTVQNVFAKKGYPVAQAFFTCTDMSILGGAFFVMDFLTGKPMILTPDWLKNKASRLPWIREGVDWLIVNRPPEPERLAVCHGDFHPLNILMQDGKITGVLDWSNFLIADPVLDIANTIVLITIYFKLSVASELGLDFCSVDWEIVAEPYLDAYRSLRPINGRKCKLLYGLAKCWCFN